MAHIPSIQYQDKGETVLRVSLDETVVPVWIAYTKLWTLTNINDSIHKPQFAVGSLNFKTENNMCADGTTTHVRVRIAQLKPACA